MSDKTRVSWMPAMQKHLLRRQRRANGIGKSPFEHWHNRWSGQSWRLSPKHLDALEIPDHQRPEINPRRQSGTPQLLGIEPCAQLLHERVEALSVKNFVQTNIERVTRTHSH